MSIWLLYSSSKGKYKCKVCFDEKYHCTGQQVMLNHIDSVHPRTSLACRNWNEGKPPEELQDGDDEGDTAAREPSLQGDTAACEPSLQDLFFGSLTHQQLEEFHMDSIECDSREDAVKKIKIISQLPKRYFISCFFPCVVDGSHSMSVEKYKKGVSYPTKGHIQDAIRHVIQNALELGMAGILGNMKSIHMVDVDYQPKYTSIPVEFHDYQDFRANIDLQSLAICECVDRIVDRVDDEDYKIFQARLLKSKTSVDLHSMLYAPYLTAERQQPIYFCSSRILSHYSKKNRISFNAIIAAFHKELSSFTSSNLRNQLPWQDALKNSKHQDLIDMLDTRFAPDGSKIPYNLTASDNHDFIFNSDKHINDKQVKIRTLEDVHMIMKKLFRFYPSEGWEYMHVHGLNSYFGSEEYAYGLLNIVNKLIESDKNFRFPVLLQALKMCCIMFAKFHILHEEKNPGTGTFDDELNVAAKEIESCINGLQCSHKEMSNCLLIRFSKYQLKPEDVHVFKSVRIILFALQFLLALVNGQHSIGCNITLSWNNISSCLAEFSTARPDEFRMQIKNPRKGVKENSSKWPSVYEVNKIAGINFIITEGGRSSFGKKISDVSEELFEMLIERPCSSPLK